MDRKRVLFVSNSLGNSYRFQQAVSSLDAEVSSMSTVQFDASLDRGLSCDMVVYEYADDADAGIARMETALAGSSNAAVLLVVPDGKISEFHLPAQLKSDFIVSSASKEECAVRARHLLWPGDEANASDFIVVESMTINLATYQVTIGSTPLDLTYLEYALLAFLAAHPNRTFSRDALLRRVWGFDYYGGSRTVDVHVRRIRAKLGPELAQHLETVRGIGYLWSA
jgi:hypothetical protein